VPENKPGAYGTGLIAEEIVSPKPPAKPPEERASDDLRLLRERAAAPIVEIKQTVNLAAANVRETFDLTATPINALIVSIYTGTLDFYLGDDAPAVAGGFPDFRFTNVGQPVQLLIPLRARRISYIANGAAVTGKIVAQCL
jgi:hypothetical protein